ncbi:MAG: hypothetical protein OHK0041_11150 [Anaerolineales bacterium]
MESTSITTASTGAKISELRYAPWGEVRYQAGTMSTHYTYTGQYSNTVDFGLMFYNARWYDPSLGRFAQADTIVPLQSQGTQAWDRYAYVNNNPVRYQDPSGHMRVEDQGSKRGCHDHCYCSISAEMNIKIGRNYSAQDGKILRDLLRSKNEDAKNAVAYLVNNNIPIKHVEKDELGKGAGAAWWNIKHPAEFNTLWIDDSQLQGDYSYGLSLVVHETVHLEQGATWAFSVLGEQEAWKVGFEVYYDLTGHYPGDQQVAENIVNLPYDASRTTLEEARKLMIQWQPDYLANWLPLYPLDWYLIRD